MSDCRTPQLIGQMHLECMAEFGRLIGATARQVQCSMTDALTREAVLGTGYSVIATRTYELPRTRDRVRCVARGESDDPSAISELQASALLLDIGAKCVEEVPEQSAARTPDFLVSWPSEATVEVEVTRKRRHRDVIAADQKALGILRALAGVREGRWAVPLSAYLASLDDGLASKVVAAAEDLNAEHPREEDSGRWTLAMGPQDFEPPSWWKPDSPLKCMRSSSTGVLLGYPSPTRGYLRAILHKCRRGQGSGHHPFLIAHDCRELVNGVCALRRPVIEAMTTGGWKHVDGVLLFRLTIRADGVIGWIWDIIPNERSHRLPTELLDQRPSEESWTAPMARHHLSHAGRVSFYFWDSCPGGRERPSDR